MGIYTKWTVTLSTAGLLAIGGIASSAEASEFTDINIPVTELGERYLRDGTFLAPRDLEQVSRGTGELTRQDVVNLLGSPSDTSTSHDDERWLYNVNLPLFGEDYLVCQYRVSFSQQVLSTTEWRRPQCAVIFEELAEHHQLQELSFSGDLLFGFDSYDISPEKQREIQQAVQAEWPQALAAHDTPTIFITGHADHIGPAEYNMRLSERRAETVANVLVHAGVSSQHIHYEGRGQNAPVTTCTGQVGADLRECLAPNRRVEISLQGSL